MRQSLTGIYLNHFSYSDSSVILKLFTKEYGVRSFVLKGVKKKRGGSAVLQPFHFLEVTSNFNPGKELNYGNSVKLFRPSTSITIDIRKSAVAIFLTEVLYKSIREEEANASLYNFLDGAIEQFDQEDFQTDFHLCFLMELTKHFGFCPSLPDLPSKKYFNVREGVFEFPKDLKVENLDMETSSDIKTLIGMDFDEVSDLKLTGKRRTSLLNFLVNYFEIHMHLKRNAISSHKILQAVFSD